MIVVGLLKTVATFFVATIFYTLYKQSY